MRRTILKVFAAAVFAGAGFTALLVHAASDAALNGEWDGSWEGAGASGSFKLTLVRDGDGKLTGGVSVGQDTGDYKATFSSVVFVDNKLVAKYDYTPDPQAEIALSATLDGNSLKGEWKMLPKGQEMELAAGTWNVAKL